MNILGKLKTFFFRHKRKIIRYSGIALIVIGLAVIIYPLYTNFVMARREVSILTTWDEAYVQDASGGEDNVALERDMKLVDPEKKLPFRISIPEINIDWIVNEGTDYLTLRKGPGFFIGSTFPGEEGTCVVAGHRTTYGAPFNRLDELEEGDEIFIETSGNEKFTYFVTEKKSVYPQDLSVLENTDYPSLVLSTCTPKFFATRRLIIFAGIEEEEIPGIEYISTEEVYEIINSDEDHMILDVRTPDEFNEGHLEDAVLIPVDELEGRLDELPTDRPIIVHCKSGVRSNTAAIILIDNGFTMVFDMGGGILDWIDKGYPVVIEEETEEYDIAEISVDEAYEFYSNEDCLFLDVRSQEGYDNGHIEGAISIPLAELESRLKELPTDKPIIIYCSGTSCNLSGQAAEILLKNGFSQVYDVGGKGINEWKQKDYPVEY